VNKLLNFTETYHYFPLFVIKPQEKRFKSREKCNRFYLPENLIFIMTFPEIVLVGMSNRSSNLLYQQCSLSDNIVETVYEVPFKPAVFCTSFFCFIVKGTFFLPDLTLNFKTPFLSLLTFILLVPS